MSSSMEFPKFDLTQIEQLNPEQREKLSEINEDISALVQYAQGVFAKSDEFRENALHNTNDQKRIKAFEAAMDKVVDGGNKILETASRVKEKFKTLGNPERAIKEIDTMREEMLKCVEKMDELITKDIVQENRDRASTSSRGTEISRTSSVVGKDVNPSSSLSFISIKVKPESQLGKLLKSIPSDRVVRPDNFIGSEMFTEISRSILNATSAVSGFKNKVATSSRLYDSKEIENLSNKMADPKGTVNKFLDEIKSIGGQEILSEKMGALAALFNERLNHANGNNPKGVKDAEEAIKKFVGDIEKSVVEITKLCEKLDKKISEYDQRLQKAKGK